MSRPSPSHRCRRGGRASGRTDAPRLGTRILALETGGLDELGDLVGERRHGNDLLAYPNTGCEHVGIGAVRIGEVARVDPRGVPGSAEVSVTLPWLRGWRSTAPSVTP